MQKVCIIEDNQRLVNFMKEFLQQERNIEVTSFANGTDALRNIKLNRPDLVILDLGLEDIIGEQVCTILKQTYPDLPIIILTGDSNKDRVLSLFNLGADDYITKPFDMDVLLARIKAKLRQSQPISNQQLLKVDSLVLDQESLTVEREGQPIQLTAKEFELLRYMLVNKNIVLSRDKILNAIWGYTSEVDTRVVDVHIGKLRKKVDYGYRTPLIQSLRGFGYKIVG